MRFKMSSEMRATLLLIALVAVAIGLMFRWSMVDNERQPPLPVPIDAPPAVDTSIVGMKKDTPPAKKTKTDRDTTAKKRKKRKSQPYSPQSPGRHRDFLGEPVRK